jgi:pre-rRNA-processing protein IPI1
VQSVKRKKPKTSKSSIPFTALPSTTNTPSQKVKLKVGKAKPKAANFTDTSFKAKSIVLKKQSLNASAPTLSVQFQHHLSLLRNRSDTQRAESLAYLTTAVASLPDDTALPQPLPVILDRVQPLLVDGNNNVRNNVLKLLRVLPLDQLARRPDSILLYTHVGMTHLSAHIRAFALEVLEWLLGAMGQDIVSCAGGWMKTLKSFERQLGWQSQMTGTKGWSMYQQSGIRPGKETKAIAKQMTVLAAFIRAGIGAPAEQDVMIARGKMTSCFPYVGVKQNMLPERSNVFAHLYLFGPPPDEEGEMYQDREERQRIFGLRYEESIRAGIEHAKKEAGEIGRAAHLIRKAMDEGMKDYVLEEG